MIRPCHWNVTQPAVDSCICLFIWCLTWWQSYFTLSKKKECIKQNLDTATYYVLSSSAGWRQLVGPDERACRAGSTIMAPGIWFRSTTQILNSNANALSCALGPLKFSRTYCGKCSGRSSRGLLLQYRSICIKYKSKKWKYFNNNY